jgi:hypothetical protein
VNRRKRESEAEVFRSTPVIVNRKHCLHKQCNYCIRTATRSKKKKPGGFFTSRPFKYDLKYRPEGEVSARMLHLPYCNISGKCLRGAQWYVSVNQKKVQTASVVPSGAGLCGPQASTTAFFSLQTRATSGTTIILPPDRLALVFRLGCGELSQ